MDTQTKLDTARAGVKRWERKLKLAATKLGNYRTTIKRLEKKQADEAAKLAQGTGRGFSFATDPKEATAGK